MVKVWALEVPPPGAGLATVTPALPSSARSDAATAAVSCVALTKVVGTAVPCHCTTELLRKLLPLTVKVKAAPPSEALVSLIPEIAGCGFVTLMAVLSEPEAPGLAVVPSSCTVTVRAYEPPWE